MWELAFYLLIFLLGMISLSQPLKLKIRRERGVELNLYLTDIYLFASVFSPDPIKGSLVIIALALLPPTINLQPLYRRSRYPLRSGMYRLIQLSPYVLITWLHGALQEYLKTPELSLLGIVALGFLASYLNSFAAAVVASIDKGKLLKELFKRAARDVSLIMYQLPSVATGYLLNLTFFPKPLILPFLALNFTLILNYLGLRYYVERFNEMDELISFLLETLHKRDEVTYSHSLRVSNLAVAIAREMGLSEDEVEKIRRAALLHDIGKIDIPDFVLFKPGKLTAFEYNLITFHPLIAFKLVEAMDISEYVGGDYILYHHEKYVGGGYPYNLSYNEIPLGARIISVADVFDALISKRPYKRSLPLEEVMRIIHSHSGIHFDPKVVSALYKLYSKGKLNFYPDSLQL